MQISTLFVFVVLCVVAANVSAQNDKISYTNRSRPVAPKFSCETDGDCGDYGHCKNGKCICNEGYTTWKTSDVCSYRQEKRSVAFILSFVFGPSGVDWFFLSRGNRTYILIGILKLIMSCGCISIICGVLGMIAGEKGVGAFCSLCSFIVFQFGSTLWYFVDWIRILLDAFKDGNGAPLAPW